MGIRIEELNPMQKNVLEFHQTFGAVVSYTPATPSEATKLLRIRLIEEELQELKYAMMEDDIVETADALADLLYVLFGTCVSYGINIQKVFDEVHRSNMSKRNPDGSVTYDQYGKVIKPPTYSPADVAGVIEMLSKE